MKGISGLLKKIFSKRESANIKKRGQQPEKMREKNHVNTEIQSGNVVKHHRVAGVSHYAVNILSFAMENPYYALKKSELVKQELFEEYIYQYDFYPGKVELIPEPTNQYDPNAVKVLIDEKLVGYIKSGSCKHILKLINENRIEKIEAEIKGGKYKCLRYGDEEDQYTFESGKKEYGIELSIYERNN